MSCNEQFTNRVNSVRIRSTKSSLSPTALASSGHMKKIRFRLSWYGSSNPISKRRLNEILPHLIKAKCSLLGPFLYGSLLLFLLTVSAEIRGLIRYKPGGVPV